MEPVGPILCIVPDFMEDYKIQECFTGRETMSQLQLIEEPQSICSDGPEALQQVVTDGQSIADASYVLITAACGGP